MIGGTSSHLYRTRHMVQRHFAFDGPRCYKHQCCCHEFTNFEMWILTHILNPAAQKFNTIRNISRWAPKIGVTSLASNSVTRSLLWLAVGGYIQMSRGSTKWTERSRQFCICKISLWCQASDFWLQNSNQFILELKLMFQPKLKKFPQEVPDMGGQTADNHNASSHNSCQHKGLIIGIFGTICP